MISARHFYMTRHGQTEANAARIMAGSIDSPLTAAGREQARAVQRIVKTLEIPPQTIVHSHLSRARETAAIINEFLNVPMHEDSDFAELHAGDWEGVPYDDCPDLLVSWTDPPNGEKFEDFFERIKRGKNRAFERHPGPVMIVCHGGVFRAFGKLYGIETQGVENCHLYEFEPAPESEKFPWRVWQYDNNGSVIRRPAAIYHMSTEEEAIALKTLKA